MARTFNDAANQYLKASTPAITVRPCTMAAWYYSDDLTVRQTLLSCADEASYAVIYLHLAGDLGGDPVRMGVFDGSSASGAVSSTAYSANTWQHACGVLTSSGTTAAYLNGANKGTDASTSNPGGLDNTVIGAMDDTDGGLKRYMSGSIAEAAIWNVALTDAEVAILAAGYSPLFVRPQSLVFYAPLIRDADRDIKGGLSLTPGGSPTVSAHPRVRYPAPVFIIGPPGTPAGGTVTATASLSGSGDVTGSSLLEVLASAGLSASGDMSGDPLNIARGQSNLDAIGALTGDSLLNIPAIGALSGQGDLSAGSTVVIISSGTLTGTGTLTAEALLIIPATASLTGQGDLSATATIGGIVVADATLTGAGTLAAQTLQVILSQAQADAAGGFDAGGNLIIPSSSNLAATGGLSGDSLLNILATGSLSGAGSLTATGVGSEVTVTTPDGRKYTVGAGTRIYYVPARNRTHTPQ